MGLVLVDHKASWVSGTVARDGRFPCWARPDRGLGWQHDHGPPLDVPNGPSIALFSTRSAAGPRALREIGQASLEKALAPLRHDLGRGVEPPGDLDVLEALCREEHDAGPNDIAIRC